jgi:hypothetical protein
MTPLSAAMDVDASELDPSRADGEAGGNHRVASQ